MKLELKHIAPYLPYDPMIIWNRSKEIYRINFNEDINFGDRTYPLSTLIFSIDGQELMEMGWKMILRPLSSLTKLRKHLEQRVKSSNPQIPEYVAVQWVDMYINMVSEPKGYDLVPHWVFQELIKNHFDVFHLIPAGLAIDIESINQDTK